LKNTQYNDPVKIEVRPASLEESALASSILTEAARWLIAKGEPLWPVEWLTPERFRSVAERGELFLAWEGSEAVGTITYQLEDKPFWPHVERGESAFFHKVAVRRRVARQGVARAMVEWAIEKARGDDLPYLRMDTHSKRPKLRAFYEELGFVYVEEKVVNGFDVALYELRLKPSVTQP
jgi:GNAT superfamily N-acetyltransferase